nr:MAG TPA: hypothetical protein [Caudoviricetes sp.]
MLKINLPKLLNTLQSGKTKEITSNPSYILITPFI